MPSLKVRLKIGYGLGDLANGLTFGMSSTFLLAFYTDVLGITAAAAGTLFLAARIWDAVNDPLMGAIVDRRFRKRRKKTKAGNEKFRPFLLKGSWPVVAAAILMFIAPAGLSSVEKIIWAYATYILWGITYTFINIPYGSLAVVMTKDPRERSSLSVFRGLGGMIGAMSVRVAVPAFLLASAPDQARGYLLSMLALGFITLCGYLAAYFMTEEIIPAGPGSAEAISFKSALVVLSKNRPFFSVALASFVMLTGNIVNGSMTIYYFRDVMDALELLGLTAFITMGAMLIAASAVPRLVGRFGTARVSQVSSLASSLFFALLWILPSDPIIYLSVSAAAFIFLMVPNIIVWGQVSDCIDYNMYLSGSRQEGMIYGACSFMRKMGQGLAGALAGWGLGRAGYVPNAEIQSAAVRSGIKSLTVGLPALAMLVAFVAYRFVWNLTPEMQAEVNKAISGETGPPGSPTE